MIYFKVPSDFDGRQVYTSKKVHHSFVADELYTKNEIRRYGIERFAQSFESVEVSMRRTCWFFGARFEIKD